MLAQKLAKAQLFFDDAADQSIDQALAMLKVLQDNAVDPASSQWAEAYLLIGKAYRQSGNLEDAIQYVLLAEEASEATRNKTIQLESITLISFIYLDLGLYEKATEYSLKRLRLAQQLDDQPSIIGAHNHLGVILYEHSDHDQALIFLKQALELSQASDKTPFPLSIIYTNMSRVYLQKAEFNSAKVHAERALELYEIEHNTYCLTEVYAALAEICLFMREIEKAFEYAMKALEVADEFDSDYWRVHALLVLGLLYIQALQPNKGLEYLHYALELALQQSMFNAARDIHEQLSRAYRDVHDYEKSLNHYQQYHQLYKRIYNAESNRRIRMLEVIHKTEQAQQEIDRQKALRVQDQDKFEKISQLQQQFVQTASHDIKTPLTSIRFNLELMERHPEFPSALEKYVERIDSSTDKITHLVLDVLDLAKLDFEGAFQFEEIDLLSLLETVINEQQDYARENRMSLQVLTSEEKIQILGDDIQLRQALTNLITNGIKYNQADGEVVVTANKSDKQVFIQFRDTGIGIPQKELQRIFEPFYRGLDTKKGSVEGTGLGLHLCQRIIESHDGTISVESTIGVGTTFTVVLPLKQ